MASKAGKAGRTRGFLSTLAVTLAVLLAGCGRGMPGSSEREGGGTADTSGNAGRTWTMLVGGEPESLNRVTNRQGPYRPSWKVFNAGLVITDGQGVARPYLAEEVPQLNTDSWRVFPDGRMETTYRLKSGLSWHDAAPLSAEDIVFSWRVHATPELGAAGLPPQKQIQEVRAPDQRTIVISWSQPYPGANMLTEDVFPIVPRHLLEESLRTRPEGFLNQLYWSREFVGLGAYRLEQWTTGAFLEAIAFDGHALGRPKIERVRLTFGSDDPNAVLVSMLAGGTDYTWRTMRTPQAIILKREWATRSAGDVLFNPTRMRFTQIQLRPERAHPPELRDVRVRRALAHALDKEALNLGLFEGDGMVADTTIPNTMPYNANLDRSIAKYPLDVRRTEQLMNEAGFVRGADGVFVGPAGQRFAQELWQASQVVEEQELAIMRDSFQRAGLPTGIYAIPPAQLSDGQLKSSFPALLTTGGGFGERGLRSLYSTESIGTPENRFAGGLNFGGWSNPEFDRMLRAFELSLDRRERDDLVVEMATLVSQDVPLLPLYFEFDVVAHSTALRGPRVDAPDTVAAWNLHEWELRP